MNNFIRLLLLMFTCSLWANSAVVLDDNKSIYDNFNIAYYLDKNGTATIDTVSAIAFKDQSTNAFTFGYETKPVWFKIDIENNSTKQDFYLYFKRFSMERFTVYAATENGWKKSEFGWKQLDPNILKKFYTPIYPLHIRPHEKKELYVQIQTSIGLVGKFIIYANAVQMHKDITNEQLLFMFVVGSLLMAILINGYLYFRIHEKVFAYYVGYLSTMALFMLFSTNLGVELFGPAYFGPGQVFGSLTVVFALLFANEFLKVKEYFPTFSKYLIFMALIFAVLSVLIVFDLEYWFSFMGNLATIAFLSILFVAFKIAYSGHVEAKYYFMILVINFSTIALMTMVYDGTLPYSDVYLYAYLYTFIFEAAAFSFLLVDRINKGSLKIIQIQKELIKEKSHNEENLENVVQERTQGIVELNDKLKYQAEHDPLTGLYNRHFLETVSAKLFKPGLSVLLLDIDHFKKVNDTYGHSIGDVVLKQVASAIQENLRKSDIAIRYGGEEYLMLLPNTDIEAAITVAEKLRKHIEKINFPYNNLEFNISVSIGTASYKENDDNIENIIRRSDVNLYRAKNSGRNRVV